MKIQVGKQSRARVPRTFTVSLDKLTAERLGAFCDEFRGVTPESVIAEAAHTSMDSAATDTVYRYDTSINAREFTQRNGGPRVPARAFWRGEKVLTILPFKEAR